LAQALPIIYPYSQWNFWQFACLPQVDWIYNDKMWQYFDAALVVGFRNFVCCLLLFVIVIFIVIVVVIIIGNVAFEVTF